MDQDQSIATKTYGEVCLRRTRRKRQKLLVSNLFLDYARNTTLHGIPYIAKKGLTIPEKIFWILTVIISVSLCSVAIYQLWFRWKMSPVIVTISEETVPVSMVPFPSVTICPQAKCKASIYNYTDELIKLENLLNGTYVFSTSNASLYFNSSIIERINILNDMKQICLITPSVSCNRMFVNRSIIDTLEKVSPSHDDVFGICNLRTGYDLFCEKTFKKVITREGVCFTANSLPYNEIFRTKEKSLFPYKTYLEETRASNGWTIDKGYNDSVLDPYPAHGIENANVPELSVVLTENVTERSDLCNTFNNGFKVYIHHPSDLPQSSMYSYAVLSKQLSSIALSFNVLNTSETLRPYSPEVRQCYFPEERYLKYFRHYTAKNCWIECLSNYTFKKCDCVDLYMPHDNSNRMCAEGKEDCVQKAKDELVEEEASSPKGCHCLPACLSVEYEAEILKTEYDRDRLVRVVGRMYSENLKSDIVYSKLELYYKRPQFLSMRRSELFGTTEFLANCGGLLGLFMGFSFLTFVELLYFLTLRLWCTLKKDLKKEKTPMKIEKKDLIKKF